MIKKILLTAALLVPGLAYGQVSAPLDPPVTPAAQDPTPPTQAAAAGFTTLLVNFDFENNQVCAIKGGDTTQTCVGASPASNWLDCGGTDTSKFIHFITGQGYLPCTIGTYVGLATDPATGKPSFFMRIYTTDPAGAQMGYYTAPYGNPSSNTGYITWPQGHYVESEYRIDQTWPPDVGGNAEAPYEWQNGPDCVTDFQLGELYPNKSGGSLGGGNHNWCGSNGHPYMWYFPAGSYGGGNNLPAGYAVTQTHTYGSLRTSNGTSSLMDCAYVDNIFQYAGQTAGCSDEPPPGRPIDTMRTFMIYGLSTANPFGNVAANLTLWIHWMRVWSCNVAAATAGQCDGSTLTGSQGSGAVAYWH
jgi:hypothetical protein